MTTITKNIARKIKNNKKQLLFCFVATFTLGFLVHGFALFNNIISFDSVREFAGDGVVDKIKIEAGRIFIPIYRNIIRPNETVSCVIGVLSFIWLSIAIFFTTKIFDIKTKFLTLLTVGLFVINQAVISVIATYIHDLDCDMFALMLSVIAVYLWKNSGNKGIFLAMVLICLMLGLFQAYIAVAITFVLFILILQLFDGEKAKPVIIKGLKAAAILIGGGILYYISIKVCNVITGVTLSSGLSNSLGKILDKSYFEIVKYVVLAPAIAVYEIFTIVSYYPMWISIIIIGILFVIAAIPVCLTVFNKNMKLKERWLTILLVMLLPLGMNICGVITCLYTYDIMYFAVYLVFFLFLLVSRWQVEKLDKISIDKRKVMHYITTCLTCVLIWNSICVANGTYLKRKMEHDSNLSLFTQIVSKMESVEEYVPGETEVMFIGVPKHLFVGEEQITGFETFGKIAAAQHKYIVVRDNPNYIRPYFKYVLMNRAILADEEIRSKMKKTNKEVRQMPVYPHKDSIKMVDGYLVVKLGD